MNESCMITDKMRFTSLLTRILVLQFKKEQGTLNSEALNRNIATRNIATIAIPKARVSAFRQSIHSSGTLQSMIIYNDFAHLTIDIHLNKLCQSNWLLYHNKADAICYHVTLLGHPE